MTAMNDTITYHIERSNTDAQNTLYLTSDAAYTRIAVFYSGANCQTLLEVEPTVYAIDFTYSNAYLKTFGDDVWSNSPAGKRDICCHSQLILHEMVHTKLTGTLKNMLIQSKAIELLLCCLRCETKIEDNCAACKFLSNPYEKEKIHRARHILLENLVNPPIIPELAKQVGINQCYLKKGFKDLFDTTIFAFVQEQRILKAKLLLKTTDTSLSDIAEQVGFSNPSNFTNAFKNFTGILPSDIRNN